jgi:hypothetical protein
MLNPSTADATEDDPTIRRCVGFARRERCGVLEVVNLFAFRATNPQALRSAPDPVGPANDRFIEKAVERADLIVVAWGAVPRQSGEHGRSVRGSRTTCPPTVAAARSVSAPPPPEHPATLCTSEATSRSTRGVRSRSEQYRLFAHVDQTLYLFTLLLAPMPSGLLLWRGSVRSLSLGGRSGHDRMAAAAPTLLPSRPPITDRIALGALPSPRSRG